MAQGRQEDFERGPRLIARSGLRFDKVALGFVARLQEALRSSVPAGKTLVVSCTAPIRKSSVTSAALIALLQSALARGSARLDVNKTIEGNRIRARLIERSPAHLDTVIGFIHNRDVDAEELLLP